MKSCRTLAVAIALTSGLFALPAHAGAAQNNASGDPLYTVEAPSGFAMVGDLIIARPLLIGATAIGAAAFIVSLPFTALGGNVGEAAHSLIATPGQEAFMRCLGCTTSGYKED